MQVDATTLAARLGKTVHISPLQMKAERLRRRFPCESAECLEDWLVAVANARGARAVVLPRNPGPAFEAPPVADLTDEELVVSICQLQRLDRPQMLRLAAQLVSREAVAAGALLLIARRERVEPVLAELSRQALRVDPNHVLWRRIRAAFGGERELRAPLLHWTRLAEPVMRNRQCNAASWRLVA